MAGNSFGELFRITTFGESHGPGIGAVIDGCPAGLPIDLTFIQQQLDRRKPGQSHLTSPRTEKDLPEILSGIFEGTSTGAPIAFFIRNSDQRSNDYLHLQTAFRPGHADFTYQEKYGLRDYRGGGRSSARETAARVMAGAVAQLLLQEAGIAVHAYVTQVGGIKTEMDFSGFDFSTAKENIVRCPDPIAAVKMIALIEEVRKAGDTVGGVISCVIKNVPAGLGEPVFDRLHADLAKAMMSINAAKGFDLGSGFEGAAMFGSQHNDHFTSDADRKIGFKSNHSGGILGGISNGAAIQFRVAFKPVSTLMKTQLSINHEGLPVQLEGKGRHDPCVVPRAVPIVEAMAALVIADHWLRSKTSRLNQL